MYSILKIQEILAAEPLQLPNKTAVIEHLLTDTRRVAFPETSLFFPLVGRFHDGHDFIAAAYARGIRNFLISKPPFSLAEFQDANFLKVDSIRGGLQKLAAAHRRAFSDLEVVGITGSNGKTVVKEWLFQLLREDYNIVRSPKSYNSKTGVPLSVWQIKSENNLALFEAGISTTNEMAVLAEIIKPTIGIFTMIGEAHNEGFVNTEEKIKEKLKLFNSCKSILFCADDALISELIKKEFPDKKLLSWSKENNKANLQLFDYQIIDNKTYFNFKYANKSFLLKNKFKELKNKNKELENNLFKIELPFTDTASINNAATCILALLALKTAPPLIAPKIAKLEPIEMRLELKRGVNSSFVVNDAYNSDFTSLSLALDFIAQNAQLSRTLILSDILQSGQNAATLYRKVADLLVEKGISKLIGIGTEITAIQPFLNENITAQFFESTQLFLNQAKNVDFQHQIILLKGARPFVFERIAERLSEKNHKTVLEINLNALTHNLSVFKNILRGEFEEGKFEVRSLKFEDGAGVLKTIEVSQPTTLPSPFKLLTSNLLSSNFKPQTSNLPKIMAMVKASAYGNGSDEVARLLEYNHVDYLAVAYADEGIELRQAGITLPIMVMNPEEASFDALQRYDLEPEIYSLRVLENFAKSLSHNFKIQNSKFKLSKIHLKLDTGMHRLGFELNDIPRVVEILNAHKNIEVAAVFTHLAASEAAQHDGFTRLQVERFSTMYAQIVEDIGYKPMRHVLNSSGIVRFPEYRFDMVRLGIGLYGVDGSAEIQPQLQVVQTLKATISQIRNLPKTETIGYSRRGKLERDSIIATISIGYADGLLRGAGNGRFSVGIHRQRAPIIGGVCMDMTMIDITDIPNVIEGDEVEIFGKNVPVQELADALQTIPYEVFTGISERVKRVYFQE